MATITRDWAGLTVTFPGVKVLGYQTTRRTRNIVHELLGGGVAVTQRGSLPRAGTLTFLFPLEAEAASCAAEHALPGTWTLTDSDRPTIAMSYVVSGDVSTHLDAQTGAAWTVAVAYQEVA